MGRMLTQVGIALFGIGTLLTGLRIQGGSVLAEDTLAAVQPAGNVAADSGRKIEVRFRIVQLDDRKQERASVMQPLVVKDGSPARFVRGGEVPVVRENPREGKLGTPDRPVETISSVTYSPIGTQVSARPWFIAADRFGVDVSWQVRRAEDGPNPESKVITGSLAESVHKVKAEEVLTVVIQKDADGKPTEWAELSLREAK